MNPCDRQRSSAGWSCWRRELLLPLPPPPLPSPPRRCSRRRHCCCCCCCGGVVNNTHRPRRVQGPAAAQRSLWNAEPVEMSPGPARLSSSADGMLGRDETQRSPGVSHCAAVRGRRACVADQTRRRRRRRRCRHPLGPRTVSLSLSLSLCLSPHLTSATSPARVRPAQSVKRISGHIR